MRSDRRLAALALLLLLAAGCRRKPPAPASPPLPTLPIAAAPGPLRFEPDAAARLGLPAGCALVERPRSAPLGPPSPVFFAPDEPRGELVVALPGADAGALRIGVSPLGGGAARPLPRFDLGQPLSLAAAGGGWLALVGDETVPGRALVVREGGKVEEALMGEGLEPADLRCRGGRCVALTSRAMRLAGAGASVLVGDGAAPVGQWQRADHAPEEDERPFIVARVEPPVVTTTGPGGVRFVAIEGREARPGPVLPAPFGALDAIALRRPVVVAHGAKLEGDCAVPRPALALVREGDTRVLPLDAPPLALFVRPLGRGALAAWLVPTHCGDRRRQVAYLARLDEDGALAAGPMALTDATGLAVATSGDQAEVWLRQGERVTWLRLRCD